MLNIGFHNYSTPSQEAHLLKEMCFCSFLFLLFSFFSKKFQTDFFFLSAIEVSLVIQKAFGLS